MSCPGLIAVPAGLSNTSCPGLIAVPAVLSNMSCPGLIAVPAGLSNTSCPGSISVPAGLSNTHPTIDTNAYRDEDWKGDEDDEGNYSSCNDTTNYRMIRKESEITLSATDICLQHEMTILYRGKYLF